MLDWLTRIARRLSGRDDSRRDPQSPDDPFGGVRHPIARRPGGRSAAAAVEEPHEDHALTLIGSRR